MTDTKNPDSFDAIVIAPAGFDKIAVEEGEKEDFYISNITQVLKSDYMEIELNKGALIKLSVTGNLHSIFDKQNDFIVSFNKQKIICCKNEYNSFIGCVSPKFLKIKENVVFNVMKQPVEFAGNSFLTFDRGVVKGKVAKDVEFTKILPNGKEKKLFVPKGRYFDIRKFSLV